jgi:penicillin-binding protein 1C
MHLVLLPLLALLLHAVWLGPLRPRLDAAGSVRVLDRAGQTLADVRDARFDLAVRVRRDELGPWVEPALLATEDARFFWHVGVDPLALLRSGIQALRSGRVISGGSTLTQQLARTLFQRPRTFGGKWCELAYSLRLEAELDKGEILEAYLDRVYFGPRVRGIAAASRYYFDKPPSALSLAEAAALVAAVQAPSRLDPERHGDRLTRRRDLVLGRMLAQGVAGPGEVALARSAPLALHRGLVLPGAYHFVRAAVSGKLALSARRAASGEPGGTDAPREESSQRESEAATPRVLHSTLDGELQARVENLVRSFAPSFAAHRASAAAVLVVDNRSASVRAYVGAPDHRVRAALGQNDGVLALRQPGSTLKPFVYALAMAEQGLNAASLLPDLEQRFGPLGNEYVPHDYDRRFHGPVRLGQALAASLNVPAVTLAERLGPERVLGLLTSLGFSHLEEPAAHYGPAIALGVAEVQLTELAAAYSALARGGEYLPLRFFETDRQALPERVLAPDVAHQILAILSEPRERAATFGRDGPLELDEPVAVKTGTSKGNRDNWVIGADAALTVAVWVGNFDGSPMLSRSAASGSAPLFHAVMEAARRRLAPIRGEALAGAAGTSDAPAAAEVCALSGMLAGPSCPHRLALDASRNRPTRVCDWHRRRCNGGVAREDDLQDDLRNENAACPVVEVLPELYAAWARDTGRGQRELSRPPATGTTDSAGASPGGARGNARRARKNGAEEAPGSRAPAITFPRPDQRFMYDDRLGGEQVLVFAAQAGVGPPLAFEVDGSEVCAASGALSTPSTLAPSECRWPLRRGRHELVVRAGARFSKLAFGVE